MCCWKRYAYSAVMVHCKKSWVWTVRQSVIPWLCSQRRTTFWVSSDGRMREDTSSRVRCLPVEDKTGLCHFKNWGKIETRSVVQFGAAQILDYQGYFRTACNYQTEPYHIVLSQGLKPVWVSPLAGRRFAASGQMSAPASLRGRPGPHESSPLVSWGKRRNLSWFTWPKQNNYSILSCDSTVNWTLEQAFGYITLIWPFFLTKTWLINLLICDSVHVILFLQTSQVL